MADQKSPAEIEDAAVDWVAKVERGLTANERAILDQWLEDDTRHLGAFVRAQAAWIHAERAMALGAMSEAETECPPQESIAIEAAKDVGREDTARRVDRRTLLAGGGALAASIVAAGYLTIDRSLTIESSIGEVRRLTLAEGTTLTLDTDTRIEVARGSDDRKLKIVHGKLFLDIMSGAARPLIVESGGLLMEMTKGAFAVQSLLEGPLITLVADGRLLVSQGGGLFRQKRSLVLASDQALTLPEGADLTADRVGPMAREQREQFLAWRDGMLAFGGEALSSAIRAFDRYGPMRIEISDPDLAAQKITGLFKADDPKGFATAVAASFGALVSQQGNNLRIYRENRSGG